MDITRLEKKIVQNKKKKTSVVIQFKVVTYVDVDFILKTNSVLSVLYDVVSRLGMVFFLSVICCFSFCLFSIAIIIIILFGHYAKHTYRVPATSTTRWRHDADFDTILDVPSRYVLQINTIRFSRYAVTACGSTARLVFVSFFFFHNFFFFFSPHAFRQ